MGGYREGGGTGLRLTCWHLLKYSTCSIGLSSGSMTACADRGLGVGGEHVWGRNWVVEWGQQGCRSMDRWALGRTGWALGRIGCTWFLPEPISYVVRNYC